MSQGHRLPGGSDTTGPPKNKFQRAVTDSPWVQEAFSRTLEPSSGSRGASTRFAATGPSDIGSDDDFEEETLKMVVRRSVSEPSLGRRRISLVDALDAVDTALPFASLRPAARAALSVGASQALPQRLLVNGLLSVVSLFVSCLVPVLVDLSKTATLLEPGGAGEDVLPYSALSIVRAEAFFNVVLGLVAIVLTHPLGGFEPLMSWELHWMMLPLTFVYCLGDIATLLAICDAGGPLYIAISSSRLLFAAGLSHVILGRRQSLRQWAILAAISVATIAYALLGRASRARAHGGADIGSARAIIGISWAVAKALLSGVAAVLTENRYKNLNIWHANTLLKAQSLGVALFVTMVRPVISEDVPSCDQDRVAVRCMTWKGWDRWTWAVLIAEIGTGWLSVAVLTRMSAIAKYICKTATAPTLYLLYCGTGWGGFHFQVSCFGAVLMIALGILAYVVEPHLPVLLRAGSKAPWAGLYSAVVSRPRPRN
mmetsp:Transcript_83384/g.232548  ORF Transcript_83384/g.232548 Transcript_83384/m.232548 type:complete len:484 (+) Transcript_83384:93-1544(+)